MNFVLLTAAVTPAPQFSAVVSDPAERLAQYQQALSFWANKTAHTDWKVVVVETTGCPPSNLTARTPPSLLSGITVFPFEARAELLTKGKGCVEAAAIDSVISSDQLKITDNSTFFKVTGRLIVENAVRILSQLPPNTAMVRRSLDGRYCDTRFFGTTVKFWRDHLTDMESDVNDDEGRYLEHVLAHRLSVSEYRQRAEVSRFPLRPQITGQSGTSGDKYGHLGDFARAAVLRPVESILARHLTSKQV